MVSAITSDGIDFELEDGYRIRSKQNQYDSHCINAAEAVPPAGSDDKWAMFFSAWQDVPPGTEVPVHPSHYANAETDGSDEDMSPLKIGEGKYRMYYACCDREGNWRIASAVTQDTDA